MSKNLLKTHLCIIRIIFKLTDFINDIRPLEPQILKETRDVHCLGFGFGAITNKFPAKFSQPKHSKYLWKNLSAAYTFVLELWAAYLLDSKGLEMQVRRAKRRRRCRKDR